MLFSDIELLKCFVRIDYDYRLRQPFLSKDVGLFGVHCVAMCHYALKTFNTR